MYDAEATEKTATIFFVLSIIVLSADLPCISPDILRFITENFREPYLTDL